MATIPYTVRPGDTLVKIARAHGVATWQEIYRHPDNAAFRARRPNPDRIFPGDVVRVPGGPAPGTVVPVGFDGGDIVVTPAAPPSSTTPDVLTVVHPLSLAVHDQTSPLDYLDVSGVVQALHFEVRKGGAQFWVGAAVPQGTVDFARAQLFFHPQPGQAGMLDAHYPQFTGAWPGLYRYVPGEGRQLAAAGRRIPLLVPFMRQAATSPTPANHLFADRPVETLGAVLAAVRSAAGAPGEGPVQVAEVGATGFSSGITYLAQFVRQMQPSGLLREAFDLDGSFTHEAGANMETAGRARYVRFGQTLPAGRPDRIPLQPARWSRHAAPRTQKAVHGYIGRECYYGAMVMSILRPVEPTA